MEASCNCGELPCPLCLKNEISGAVLTSLQAATTACNGLGGVAGAFIVRQKEAPRYLTAIWVSIGYVTLACSVCYLVKLPTDLTS